MPATLGSGLLGDGTLGGSTSVLPADPTNLSPTLVTSSRIDLQWDDNAVNEQFYDVERSVNAGIIGDATYGLIGSTALIGEWVTLTGAGLPANTTTYSDTGRTPGTTYLYRVRARNAAGSSGYSTILRITTLADTEPPQITSGPTVADATPITLTIVWTTDEPADTQINYGTVLGSPTDSTALIDTPVEQGGTGLVLNHSQTIPGLNPSTTYYFEVISTDATGNLYAIAPGVGATTDPNPAGVPAAPTGLTATLTGTDRIDVAWTDNAADETGYSLEHSTDGLNYNQLISLPANTVAYQHTGLGPNSTHYYRTRAFNLTGPSLYSNIDSKTTPVAGGLTITTLSLPGATLTAAYSQVLGVSGGTAPYTWTRPSGAQPNGIALNASSGLLSGTPTGTTGTYTFTIQVTDATSATASRALSIVLSAAPVVTTTTLPGAQVGTVYSQTLVASGGTLPLSWTVVSGTLPAGTTLNAGNGVLSGTPTTAETASFTVRATDVNGVSDDQALSVVVSPAPAPVISGITVTALAHDAAQITATTDIPAVVRINYGLTAGYGSATADGPQGILHVRTVPGLSPSTPYHYQVRAANGASVTLSSDGTFTTTAAPVSNRTLPTYLIDVAWSRARAGAFTIGSSTIGSSAQIGGLYSHFTFDSIKGDVKEIDIQRGRAGQDGAMSAGTLRLTLRDLTGLYNPENAGSSLAPNLLPLRPIRVRATHNAITYGLFFGFITRIEHDPHPNVQETRIEAIDFFYWLDACRPIVSLPETTVGAAIMALLSACGLSDPAYLAIDTGHRIPFLIADGTKSALQLIQELLVVDMGVLFVDGAGVVTYHDTTRRYAAGSVDDTFTSSLIGAARPGTDIALVRNGWTVTRTSLQGQPLGPPQTAYDATTRDLAYFGPRDGDPISSPHFLNDTQAGSLAAFKVLLYKEPVNPVRGIRLANTSDTLIVKQLSRDVGDRVALSESLGGTSTVGFIESVQHHIWEAGTHHEVTYTISKRRIDVVTIGTSTIGSAHVIGY